MAKTSRKPTNETPSPWAPSSPAEQAAWAERAAAEARAATPTPSPTRVQARQQRIQEMKARAKAEGTTKEVFPTATPWSYTTSYPLTVVLPSTPTVIADEAPVSEGELVSLANEINKRFTLADRLDAQAEDHRLAAAIRLAEAKKLCEDKSIPFRKWAEAHIPHAFITVRTLAKIGSDPNPKIALENYRTKNAEANKALRERKKLEVQALVEANPEVAAEIEAARPAPAEPVRVAGKFVALSPIDAMLREFDRLEREAKAEFLRRAAEHMGALVELPE